MVTVSNWRRHSTHAEESKAVKAALVKAGYTTAKVGHGSGTAWGWLEIRVTVPGPTICKCDTDGMVGRCSFCQDVWRFAYTNVKQLAQECTGRHGDYDGDILVEVNFR